MKVFDKKYCLKFKLCYVKYKEAPVRIKKNYGYVYSTISSNKVKSIRILIISDVRSPLYRLYGRINQCI